MSHLSVDPDSSAGPPQPASRTATKRSPIKIPRSLMRLSDLLSGRKTTACSIVDLDRRVLGRVYGRPENVAIGLHARGPGQGSVACRWFLAIHRSARLRRA